MSRRIEITGGVECQLVHLAQEVIAEMPANSGLHYDTNRQIFVYDGLDDDYQSGIMKKAEARYGLKLQSFRIQQVEENAKKQGCICKKQVDVASGKVKIILTRRVYG